MKTIIRYFLIAMFNLLSQNFMTSAFFKLMSGSMIKGYGPLAVDQYSRFMAKMYNEQEIMEVTSVWQTFFGRPEHGSQTIFSPDAKVVEIDIMRGNRRMAALIHRGTNSESLTVGRTKGPEYSNFVRVYPLARELGDITADQILNRVPGEKPYENKNRVDRMRILAHYHHMEHIRRFARLFEYLAGQSLLTGKQPGLMNTNNADYIYDFCRNSGHTITPAIPWDMASTSVPETDIDSLCTKILIDSKVKPDVAFFSADVMEAFMKSVSVRQLTDKLYFGLVQIGPDQVVPKYLQPLVDAGAIPRGRIQTPAGFNLWVFTYLGYYDTATGEQSPNTQDYLPSGTAFIGKFGARCDRYFGPPEVLYPSSAKAAWYQEMFGFSMLSGPIPPNIDNLGAVIHPAMFYNDAYQSPDDTKITVRTETAPIFATTQTDAFGTLHNLIASSS